MENNHFQSVCHYHFENGSSQFVFLDGSVIDHSKSFFTENFLQTLASSNGLILLFGFSVDQPCYYVFNPLTKQSFAIPQASIVGRVVRVGLAYDGSEFQVVVVEAGSSESNGLELHIFSSDTAIWRRHNPVNLTLPPLPEFEFQELGIPPLYSNGAIHWEIGGYLLVYNVQGSNCELYQLPNFLDDRSWQLTMTYRCCLCESGSRVYYCYVDFDGVHIWELLDEHDHLLEILDLYYAFDSKKFRWKLVSSVMYEVFLSKYQGFYGSFNDWDPYKIAPIAYSEQAQNIYLQIPGSVVSYNFDTGNVTTICSYSYPGNNFNCCKFFPLTTFGISNEQKEKGMLAMGEKELNLPIAELERLSL